MRAVAKIARRALPMGSIVNRRSVFIWIGIVLIIAGGAMLAFGGESFGPAVGTTFGIAGIGLLAWAWLIGGESDR